MGAFHVYNKTYAGRCYWTERRSNITGVFTYDDDYLSGNGNWAIDPALALVSGAQAAKNGLPGAFRDTAPDRWGRNLIRRRFLRESRASGNRIRNINEIDYLLGVSDFARQGDLRFSLERGGAFQYPSSDVPKLVSLPNLLNAVRIYESEQNEQAISYLLDAGSASLGGARPKAAVYDGEDLYMAKFPHKQDKWDVVAWEWIVLQVAAEAGISVPANKLVKIDGQNVLLVRRFDRSGNERIGYISAMTLLGLTDFDQADYSEIAEKIRDICVSVKSDLQELYRRIVLSVLINNTDDHLRNHGFLRSGCGWRLSPVFDINPNPDASALRSTSVFSEVEKEAALEALRVYADAFDLTPQDSATILSEVTTAVKSCTKYADRAGIPKSEQKMLLPAFG